jgi:hypothetical protein
LLVAVTDRWIAGHGNADGFELFFLECGGTEHHGGLNTTKVSHNRLKVVMKNVKNDMIDDAEIQ